MTQWVSEKDSFCGSLVGRKIRVEAEPHERRHLYIKKQNFVTFKQFPNKVI